MDLIQAKPQTIVFNNQILTTFEKDGVRYVAIKPICENMGIEWSTQLQKLNRNKEKFGCVHMNIPSKGGNQSTLCLPIKKLNGWLFSINTEKIKDDDIRNTVNLYQEECFEVLHDYWQNGIAVNKRMSQNFENLSIEDLLNASLEQGKTATEICNQVTKAENISFGMGSLHGKGLNKRKKEKKILKELQAITLKWMQFKLPFVESKAV